MLLLPACPTAGHGSTLEYRLHTLDSWRDDQTGIIKLMGTVMLEAWPAVASHGALTGHHA